MENKFEILTFKDGDFSLPVNVSPTERTLWLSSAEMALLFDTTSRNIRLHISNIFKEEELDNSVGKKSFLTAADGKNYETMIYNLEMVLSVGYRVKSKRGNIFRRWASKVLDEYLFTKNECYECREKIIDLQNQIYEIKDSQNKSLTLKETDRIDSMFMLQETLRSAKHLLVIVDNYFDHSFDEILLHSPAKVVVITHPKNESFDSDKYKVIKTDKFHDRYLFIDDKSYHFGESFNKLGTDISTCNYMPNFTIENFIELTEMKI